MDGSQLTRDRMVAFALAKRFLLAQICRDDAEKWSARCALDACTSTERVLVVGYLAHLAGQLLITVCDGDMDRVRAEVENFRDNAIAERPRLTVVRSS